MHNEISKLRNEVTRMPSGTEEEKASRIEKYREIFYTARNIGYFSAMVEIAPFAWPGKPISESNYRICLENAIKNRDLTSFVACKRALGEKLNLNEAQALKQADYSPVSILCELGKILNRKISLSHLSPEEWILFQKLFSF